MGGWLITRAGGSLGPADLVALRAGDTPLLIQVKSDKSSPYENFRPVERHRLSEAARQAGAEAWLVWWPPRQQPKWISESEWPG